MAHDKQTRINKQTTTKDNEGNTNVDDTTGAPVSVPVEFSNVNDAKSYFYTADQLALFDTWGETVQWAVVNDGDSKPTWLKVTLDFPNEGDAVKFQTALEGKNSDFASQRSAIGSDSTQVILSVDASSDHLF